MYISGLIGGSAIVISFVMFLALLGVGLQHPGSFLATVALVVYALYRWAKRSKTFNERTYYDNPYLDRGTPPADIVAKQQGKRTSLD